MNTKVAAASRRSSQRENQSRDGSATVSASGSVDGKYLEADNVLGPSCTPSANASGLSKRNFLTLAM